MVKDASHEIAARMHETLNFDPVQRRVCLTRTDAFRRSIRQVEDTGMLVMVSGVVLSNNGCSLDSDEFRYFTLSDPFAPLMFVNGADTELRRTVGGSCGFCAARPGRSPRSLVVASEPCSRATRMTRCNTEGLFGFARLHPALCRSCHFAGKALRFASL